MASMKTAFAPVVACMVAFEAIASCGGRTNARAAADSGSAVDGGYTVDAGTADSAHVADASASADVAVGDADSALGEASTDSGITDTGIITYDGPPPEGADAAPPVGSPACEDQPCILCSDGYYHCHATVYPQCPIGISTGQTCTAYSIPSYGCFTCFADGTGYQWQCTSAGWSLSQYTCTP
jgi:hypothetical protein